MESLRQTPSLRHHALGERIPDSPHAVTSSLPTLDDVCGYEEKRDATMAALCTGYPRFLRHPYFDQLAEILREHRTEETALAMTSSERTAARLREHLGAGEMVISEGPFQGGLLRFPAAERDTVDTLLQHTGWRASSRQAEDALVAAGQMAEAHPEAMVSDDPAGVIRSTIAEVFDGVEDRAIHGANCGMGAFLSLYRAINRVQARYGRSGWIQWGWLYLDTAKILQKFPEGSAPVRVFYDIQDLDSLEAYLSGPGKATAALMVEVPTNPLVQTVNLPRLSEVCRRHGVLLVVDPSVVSPVNVRVLPWADAVVFSLTKYAASEGDVLAGAVVVNPSSSRSEELQAILTEPESIPEPLYARDAARLAYEIQHWREVTDRLNQRSARLAEFLSDHPAVERVHAAQTGPGSMQYREVVRPWGGPGAVVTAVFRKPFREVYDRLRVVKGPSFGTRFTIATPFLYLAHYDLVTNPEKRRWLESLGLAPELLRISVGLEPAEEIVAAFAEVLD